MNQQCVRRQNFTRPHRAGGIYLAVLGASMIVTVIGVGALLLGRVQKRSTDMAQDAAEARLAARAAVELGKLWIVQDASWRQNRLNGAWATNQSIGRGTLSLSVTDPNDANLANFYTDSVLFLATGSKGTARHKIQVKLTPDIQPLTCLQTAACAGSISLNSAVIRSDQTLVTNSSMSAVTSTVSARVEAVGAAVGATYNGDVANLSLARTMPDSTVFDWYVRNGTPISISSIGSNGGWRQMENVLLSPATNPYGAGTTNAQGIYILDVGGAAFRIRNCRIVGTLVILNAGSKCYIDNVINWEPAVSNYPAVMVQGGLTLDYDAGTVSESSVGRNLNPAGTPYNGASNATNADTYPSIITGLIYTSGNLVYSTRPTVRGQLIVGGALSSAGGTLELSYASTAYRNPPPGFMVWPLPMKVAGSSWAQQVDP